jgi:hypothetical protein
MLTSMPAASIAARRCASKSTMRSAISPDHVVS